MYNLYMLYVLYSHTTKSNNIYNCRREDNSKIKFYYRVIAKHCIQIRLRYR